MAKGFKSGGRDFVEGNPGGPGKPPLSQELRDFRNAAKTEVIEEFKYLWSLTESELVQIVNNKKKSSEYDDDDLSELPKIENGVPAIRKFMAKAILRAVKYGEMYHIDQILNRVIGKVKEEVDLNHKGSFHKQVVDFIVTIQDDKTEREVNSGNQKDSQKKNKIKSKK